MKLNRKQLRRLIESVINENPNNIFDPENREGTASLPDRPGSGYNPRKVSESIKMLTDLAAELQTAMFGAGHDMTMIGKFNKFATGFGTDEQSIKDVFTKVKTFADSEEAREVFKSHYGRDHDFTKPVEVLKFINLKFKKFNDISLGTALIDELGEDSQDMLDLNGIIPGFLRHIM